MNRSTLQNFAALANKPSAYDLALQAQLDAPTSTDLPRNPWLIKTARVFTAVFSLQTLLAFMPLYAPMAYAQVTAAPGATSGQKPLIDAAQNGVPIVHIAPPSTAGVSRNQYKDFNVGTNGLILNNSTGNVNTTLGGMITGNMQLGVTPARIILNEVVSSNPSQLRGTIEVAGQRADIVIANPNGITCDGCGFLNTPRATLSTGPVQFGAGGAIDGFNVQQGQLTIGGAGLNATNLEQLDLLARGIVIEGEVWAKKLNVIAGANQVLYGTLQATAQSGNGVAPRFAIDIKDLGGMYANQVYLVSTEKGLGVNSTGRLAALQGNLQLSVNGDLTLKDSYAKQNIQIKNTGNATLTGQTSSQGSTSIQTSGALVQTGTLDSASQLNVNATSLTNSGTMAQRSAGQSMNLQITGNSTNQGTLYSAGDLTLQAQTITDNNGETLAAGNLGITAQSVTTVGGRIASDKNITIAATQGGVNANQTSVYAGANLNINSAKQVSNKDGAWQAGQNVQIQSASLTNAGGTILATGALGISATDSLNNTGGKLLGSAAVNLSAANLINDSTASNQASIVSDQATRITTTGADTAGNGISNKGGVISGKTDVTLQTNGQGLRNASGTIVSDSTLTVNAGNLTNTQGQIVSRGQSNAGVILNVASLDNTQGAIDAAAWLRLQTPGTVNNTLGSIQAGTNANAPAGQASANIQSSSINNTGGQITSRDALIVRTGNIINDASSAQRAVLASTGANTDIQAQQLSNQGGVISAATNTTLNTQAINNTSGEISSSGNLSVNTNGQQLTNTAGRLLAEGDLRLQAGQINSTASAGQGAFIVSQKKLDIQATGLNNTASTISAKQTSAIDVGGGILTNDQGVITGQSIALYAGVASNQSGQIVADQSVIATVSSLNNSAGVVSGGSATAITSAAGINNTNGKLLSNDTVTVSASSLNNTGGSVSAKVTSIALGSVTAPGTLNNSSGEIIGAQTLMLQAGNTNNTQGIIATGGNLSFNTQGQTLNNSQGTIQTTGKLDLTTGQLNNTQGLITSATELSINSAALDNTRGQLSAARPATNSMSTGNVTISTNEQTLTNANGSIIAEGGDLTINTGNFNNNAGTLNAQQTIAITSGVMSNVRGSVGAGTTANLVTTSLDNSAGSIVAGGNLGINTQGGKFINNAVSGQQAVVSSANQLTLTTGNAENRGGLITSKKALALSTQALDSTGGEISSNTTLAINTNNQALNNTGGSILSNNALRIASGVVSNRDGGQILSNTNVMVDSQGQGFDNQRGTVQSAGSITFAVGALNNQNGAITSATDSTLNTQALNNTAGNISSDNSIRINTSGQALINDGGKLVAQNTLDITSGALINASTTANGTTSYGLIAANQDIVLTNTSLVNSGTVQAGRDLTVNTANQVTNSGGAMTAGRDLNITAGNVSNTDLGAATGVLASTRHTRINATGAIRNSAAIQAPGNISLTANSIDNSAGSVQTNSTLSFVATTSITNNNAGLIASDNQLNLDSATLDNTQGRILGNQAVAINTRGALVNNAGIVNAQQDLHINTNGQALNNTAGALQAAGNLSIQAGAITNGTMSADKTLNIQAVSLNNDGGSINSALALSINSVGDVSSVQGQIRTNDALQITATRLNNSQGTISAVTTANVTSKGGLNNQGGLIVTDSALTLDTGALNNNSGTLASVNSALDINTNGQALTNNSGGRIQALGNTTLRAGSTNNQNGIVSGNNLNLTTAGLNNNAGTISAAGQLDINSQALSNNAGLVESVGNATINTNGQALSNTNSGLTAGIVSGGGLDINAGSLNNQAGYIASSGNLTITTTGDIDNRNLGTSKGQILGNGTATLTAANIQNQGGRINALGDLNLNATNSVNNQAGELASNGKLTATASAFNNSVGTVDATDVTVTASTIDNQNGSIKATRDLSAKATSSLNNTGGTLTAKNTLTVVAPTLLNTGGTIVGDNSVSVSTSSSALGGTIASANNVTLNVNGDYANTGLLSAQKNLTINATNIDNSGVLKANDTFTANTGNLTNSGEISAQTTIINASGTVNNTGLIDGVDTTINAGTLNNTGRIYGDLLVLNAGTTNNNGSGTLAARNNLVITGGVLNNTNGGLVYAINDILVAGSLDANGNTQGTFGSVNNIASRIEAGGNISITANNLLNQNVGLQTTTRLTNSTDASFFFPEGSSQPLALYQLSTPIAGATPYYADSARFPIPSFGVAKYIKYGTLLSGGPSVCTGGSNVDICTTASPEVRQVYGTTDPIWAKFAVAPPSYADLVLPVLPAGQSTCTYYSPDSNGQFVETRSNSGSCAAYWVTYDAYSSTMTARTNVAASALNAVIDSFNADLASRFMGATNDWTQFVVTRNTTETTLANPGVSGQILASGDITLRTTTANNNDSQIIAGGTFKGNKVDNNATPGQRTVQDSGTAQFTNHTWSGGPFGSGDGRDWGPLQAYNPAPVVDNPPLNIVVYLDKTNNKVGCSIPGTNPNAPCPLAASAALADTSAAANAALAQSGSLAITGNSQAVAIVEALQSDAKKAANIDGPTIDSRPLGNLPSTTITAGRASTAAVAAQTVATQVRGPAAAQTVSYAPTVIQKVTANGTGERARDVVLTTVPRLTPPANSLFIIHAEPGSRYLVETDPRFTNGRTFLSSDYYLAQLNLDPSRTAKRYGDGFYEQQLVNDQILALTGRRFISGFSSTETEYQALMDAGIAYAKQYKLSPGVSLSADQMANLTTDIVWLTAQTVTLADGSLQQVLVPQVYLRRPQVGDLQASASLISAKDIYIKSTGDIINSGTIAGANSTTLLAEHDIINRGGSIRGNDIYARANNDLKNLSGSITGSDANGNYTSSSKVALLAGRDVVLETMTRNTVGTSGTRTNLDRIATLQGGNVLVSADRDVTIRAGQVDAAGTLSISAQRDINLATQTTASKTATVFDARNYIKTANTQDIGSSLTAGGNITLSAGQDINTRAANIDSASGQTSLIAKRNIAITQGRATSEFDAANYTSSKGLLGSKSSQNDLKESTNTSIGSSIGGNTVLINAGKDISVVGSEVISDTGTTLVAKNNISIVAATNSQTQSKLHAEQKSGLMDSGGIGFTVGKREQSADTASQSTSAAASTIGSKTGNVNIVAGNQYTQTGSDILTPGGDITILAKDIAILDAQNTSASQSESKFKQSGLSVSVTNPVLAAAQTIDSTTQAMGQTKNSRMQALAAATSALAVKNAADAVATNPASAGGVNVNIALGSSRSQSNSSATSSTSQGSTLAAGGNITLQATGGGKDSNILIQGSKVNADGNVSLSADNDISLLAGMNTASQTSTSKNSSGSIGVSVGTGGMAVNASASKGRGNSDGQDTSYTNTQVSAGNRLSISSGNNTTLLGATAAGKSVIADIGGNLTITSLQDSSTYQAKESSVGGSVGIPIGAGAFSASANASKTNINSTFQSVTQQSGIKTGDGGFDIVVAGKTALTGAAITSTDKAIQDNKNSLITGSLSTQDIHNSANYNANSTSIGVSYSGVQQDKNGNPVIDPKTNAPLQSGYNGLNASPPVALSANGSAASTTASGISGNAAGTHIVITDNTAQVQLTGKDAATTVASVNTKVSTDTNTTNALKPIFKETEIKAGFAITGAFVQQASTFVQTQATQAETKKKELSEQLLKTDDPAEIVQLRGQIADLNKWSTGGTYQQISTAFIAAVAGNVTGSSAQVIQSAGINYLQSLGAQQIKAIADTAGSETLRAGLHTLLACAGAAAGTGSCTSAAAGAAASSVINSLLRDDSNATAEQKNARSNLLSSLMAGIAAGVGGDAAAASNAARIETDNNALYRNQTAVSKVITPKIQALEDQLVKKQITAQEFTQQRQQLAASAAKIDALTTIYNASDKMPLANLMGQMSPQHALMAGEAVAGLLVVPGMATSAYELINGKSVSGQEANYFFAALGMTPALGGAAKGVAKAAELTNAMSHLPSVTAAARIAENQAKGATFEKAVIEYLGSPLAKNKEAFTITTTSGKSVTVIPDALLGGEKILEIKNVAYLANSPQLRAYVELVQAGAATKAGATLSGTELVVTTGTVISAPLQRMLLGADATVKVFDPIAKTMKNFVWTVAARS